MTAYTTRNETRVPVYRKSADSVWPLRRADGSRWCEPAKEAAA